jgi:hypothetical protein
MSIGPNSCLGHIHCRPSHETTLELLDTTGKPRRESTIGSPGTASLTTNSDAPPHETTTSNTLDEWPSRRRNRCRRLVVRRFTVQAPPELCHNHRQQLLLLAASLRAQELGESCDEATTGSHVGGQVVVLCRQCRPASRCSPSRSQSQSTLILEEGEGEGDSWEQQGRRTTLAPCRPAPAAADQPNQTCSQALRTTLL